MTLIPSSDRIKEAINIHKDRLYNINDVYREFITSCLTGHGILLSQRQKNILNKYDVDNKFSIKLKLTRSQIKKSDFHSMNEVQEYLNTIMGKSDEIIKYYTNNSEDPADEAKKWLETYSNIYYEQIILLKDNIINHAEKSKRKVRLENVINNRPFFRTLHVVIQLVSEAFVDINKHAEKDNDKTEALVRLLGEACHISQEINVLLLNGFADGAFARWRKLYEITVIMAFLNKQNNYTSKRYLDYFHVKNYELLVEFKKEPKLQYSYFNFDEKILKTNYDKILSLYGKEFCKQYGWASHIITRKRGVTFQSILALSDFQTLSYYYKLSCSQVHVDSMGMFYKLGLPDNSQDNILFGSSSHGIVFPLQLTVISMMQILAIISSAISNEKALVTGKLINKLYEEIFTMKENS